MFRENIKKDGLGGDSRPRTRSSVDREVNAGLRSVRVEVPRQKILFSQLVRDSFSILTFQTIYECAQAIVTPYVHSLAYSDRPTQMGAPYSTLPSPNAGGIVILVDV